MAAHSSRCQLPVTVATEVPTSFTPAAPTKVLSLTAVGRLRPGACSHTSHWDGLVGRSLAFTSAFKVKVHRDGAEKVYVSHRGEEEVNAG